MLLSSLSLGLLSQAQPELESPVVQGEKAPPPIELKPDLTSEMEGVISRTWWERLHHDDLNTVVISALLNNLELRSRESEVLAMKQQIKKQFALELPTLTLGTSFLRQKNSATLLSPNASQFRSGGAQVFSPDPPLIFITCLCLSIMS
jgi:outer membrane protein TolC